MYQRKRLSTDEAIGQPELLPVRFQGLSDAILADLTPLGVPDTGYFPVAEPDPEPEPIRWLHKAIYIRRFTAEERITIKAARVENPVIDDLLYVLEAAENIFLDDPDLVNGLGYLVSVGLLQPNRPAEIRA